jgi:hypothetical protein
MAGHLLPELSARGKCAPVAIAGDRPESGVRIAIERDKTKEDPPWNYEGSAFLPEASFGLRVVVTADGEVDVALGDGAPPDLAEKVRLIVRTVYRQAKTDGEAPAWRIVRWRSSGGPPE